MGTMLRAIGVGIASTALIVSCAPPAWASSSQDPMENQMVGAINTARHYGRMCGDTWMPPAKPVKWNSKLAKAADHHSADMASNNYFSHYSQSGASPFQRMRAYHYRYRSAGENLAAGRSLASPDAAVVAWLNSPGHCRILMNRKYRDVGIGRVEGGYYEVYWTADFGRKR